MRVENFRLEAAANTARVTATVIWEDCNRSAQEIFYEVPAQFTGDPSCNPDAYLVGCLIPAMHAGEKRLAIGGEVCPALKSGLLTAMGWLHTWHGDLCRPLKIEAPVRTHAARAKPPRAAVFLSGGIDSTGVLRANHLDMPVGYPGRFEDCIFVHGFDIGALQGRDKELATFQLALASSEAIAEAAGTTLIPIYTNVRHLDDGVDFWEYVFHGAALASVAHALADRLTSVSIASTYDMVTLVPHGSHPLLDPNFSSSDLQIRHEGMRFTRLDKVRLIADWDEAARNIRVCTMNPAGLLNCGVCEKCLRTMLELLVAGKLSQTPAFPVREVSAQMLEGIDIRNRAVDQFYQEMVEPLQNLGRHDLVGVIHRKSAEFHRRQAWEAERDWKGAVKRFDRRYLNSALFNTYRTTRRLVRGTPASAEQPVIKPPAPRTG